MITNGDATVKVVPVRHVGKWVGAVVALVFIAMLVHTLFSKVPNGQTTCHSNQGCWRFSWNVVGQYFTSSERLKSFLSNVL